MDGDTSTMRVSSASSTLFIIAAFLTVALLVLAVIRQFLPLRTTPGYLLVPVYLALVLPCSIILLVPIDLASAEGNDIDHSRGVQLPERTILIIWRITYWLTFILTWFILPLLGEYCDSGHRDPKDRILDSLRSNARYQLVTLATAVAGLVYFIWENGVHMESIKGLLMALAYAWGLVLAIGLMGHGLVALPRRIFRNASVSRRLRNIQTQAPKIKEGLDAATDGLDELEHTVTQLRRQKVGMNAEQSEWVDELSATSALSDTVPGAAAAIQATNVSIPAVVTNRYLADITRKLKRARHRKARFTHEWYNLCQQAKDAQMILDSASTQKLDFGKVSAVSSSILSKLGVLSPAMKYQLHMNIIPNLRVGLSIFLATASVLIVWSEIVKSFAPSLSVIGLTVVHHPNSSSGDNLNFGGQMIAAAWLLYMDASALYAISDVKVWGNRALVRRQTYAESACWYSLQVAKLTVPLSYNFITTMPTKIFQQTSFFHFLGQSIKLTPLGSGFSRFFPCFLLIPMLATLFNLYGKAKNVIGFGVLEDDSEDNPSGFGTGGWREGKALIDRELLSGIASGTVGLAPRGESLDLHRGTSSPGSSTPLDRSQSHAARIPFRDEGIAQANRQFNSVTNQQEERQQDDSSRHFYQDLGERVRNTLDTAETPEWVRNVGSAFKQPKWMQGNQRDSMGESTLSKIFGGRREPGGVRL